MTHEEKLEKSLRDAIKTTKDHMPPGREQSIVITKLEEALLWSKARDIV